MTWFKTLCLWFLARFRLSNYAICEMSRGKGLLNDFHDYHDDLLQEPGHFVVMRCVRCGKEFIM